MNYELRVNCNRGIINIITTIGKKFGWKDSVTKHADRVGCLTFDTDTKVICWNCSNSVYNYEEIDLVKALRLLININEVIVGNFTIEGGNEGLMINGLQVTEKDATELARILTLYQTHDASDTILEYGNKKNAR